MDNFIKELRELDTYDADAEGNMCKHSLGEFVALSEMEEIIKRHEAKQAKGAPDVSELRRFSCFGIEDGIYEHQFGQYVLFDDVCNLFATDTEEPK